jgi:hypothetical protein
MEEIQGSLFSRKELYRMAHDAKGNSNFLHLIPKKNRRKIMDANMHLMQGMEFENGYPILKPYTGPTDFTIVSYTDRHKNSGAGQALHFFLDDFRFRNSLWFNLSYTTYSISNYDYVFTPDFSLWRNLKTDFPNMANIYRTRFIGAYWQICGFDVIPTASWGGLNSFSFCFNGLPKGGVIAVSGMLWPETIGGGMPSFANPYLWGRSENPVTYHSNSVPPVLYFKTFSQWEIEKTIFGM